MGALTRYGIPLLLFAGLWGGCATTESPATPGGYLQSSCPSSGVIPVPPMIPFGVRSVSVLNVCLSGDTIRAATADGTVLEKPAAGIPRDYQIGEGCVVGNGEMGGLRIFTYKPFTIPVCK